MRTRPSRAQPSVFEDLPGEEWRSVTTMPGYEVSTCGRVRSWRSSHGATRPVPRLRKLVPDKDGYLNVLFLLEGKAVLRKVHQLVLETFVGPCPTGMLTRHLDRDVTHNVVGNLAWGTGIENSADMVGHGTHTLGEQNGGAKLTQVQADTMRLRLEEGEKGSDLALEYEVSQATVSRIRKGIRYGNRS